MKRWLKIVGIVIIAVVVIAIPIGYVATQFVVVSSFSDHPTVITHNGERYHVIPEHNLDKMLTLVNESGEKFFVLSEKNVKLLGPKFLKGGE